MKEDKITKRIKELQSDTRFTFKLTEDIIASIYRIAVEDCALEKKDPDKVYKKEDVKKEVDKIVSSGKEMNKRFGTKSATIDYEELQQHHHFYILYLICLLIHLNNLQLRFYKPNQ